jgi:hypothetical protein
MPWGKMDCDEDFEELEKARKKKELKKLLKEIQGKDDDTFSLTSSYFHPDD